MHDFVTDRSGERPVLRHVDCGKEVIREDGPHYGWLCECGAEWDGAGKRICYVTDEAALMHEIRDLLVAINAKLDQQPSAVIRYNGKELTSEEADRIRLEFLRATSGCHSPRMIKPSR